MHIENTDVSAQRPWPTDTYIQGGNNGVVLTSDGGSYRTAFVEAFVAGTFLRGEGPTIAEAEDACWRQYERLNACPAAPAHGPFERRQYTNGSGFCTGCGTWFPRVLPELPPAGPPSLLERAFTGDPTAIAEVVHHLTKGPDRGQN